MALPVIDFKSFTVSDLMEALTNAGYLHESKDFELAMEQDVFKHVGNGGWKYGSNRYVIAVRDDHTNGGYVVAELYIDINANGQVTADWGGVPLLDDCTDDEAIEFVRTYYPPN